jgi:methylenetetrahydrofolate--tRNA-(uracil-5-)-methyltransferase
MARNLSGVEGYLESAASGQWLGIMLAARLQGGSVEEPPQETALGALLGHLRSEAKKYQPSNVNFGLMPGLQKRMPKKMRKGAYAQRAQESFAAWLERTGMDSR